MTYEEAKKWVDARLCYGRYTPSMHNPFVEDECFVAGQMAIKSIEKQIAKTPKIIECDVSDDRDVVCPTCGGLFGDLDDIFQGEIMFPRHCWYCGQKLERIEKVEA